MTVQEPRRFTQLKIDKRFEGLSMLAWSQNLMNDIAAWSQPMHLGHRAQNRGPKNGFTQLNTDKDTNSCMSLPVGHKQ